MLSLVRQVCHRLMGTECLRNEITFAGSSRQTESGHSKVGITNYSGSGQRCHNTSRQRLASQYQANMHSAATARPFVVRE